MSDNATIIEFMRRVIEQRIFPNEQKEAAGPFEMKRDQVAKAWRGQG